MQKVWRNSPIRNAEIKNWEQSGDGQSELQASLHNNIFIFQDQQLYDRATYGLVYNGFNIVDMNAIVLLAPSFYPIMDGNSSETTLVIH